MQITGACHCGAITFTAEIDPSRVMVCHCNDCQVLSGSAFRPMVLAMFDNFRLSGVTKSYVKVAESGHQRAQVFCPECGTQLYATAVDNPTTLNIRLGCIHQRAQLRPSAEIWRRSQAPWLSTLGSMPGSQEQQAILTAR